MQKQPIVVFFLIDPLPEQNLLKEDESKASYVRLAEFAQQKLIDLRFVLGENSYSNGEFNNYWHWKDGKYIQYFEQFKASMIYAKNLTRIFDEDKRVNNVYLEKVACDKLLTAELFPAYVKKTLPITSTDLSPLRYIQTEMVVLKPRYGSDGVNVKVLPKSQVTADLLSDDDTYLAQEFIESSGGIPGLIDRRHEMRCYIFNGEVQSAYLRLPASGSYLSNIAQGAVAVQIRNDQVPDTFRKVIKEVDEKFSDVSPRLYCIDLMNEGDQPWIVELNNSPGLPDVAVQPLTDNYLSALLDLCVDGFQGQA